MIDPRSALRRRLEAIAARALDPQIAADIYAFIAELETALSRQADTMQMALSSAEFGIDDRLRAIDRDVQALRQSLIDHTAQSGAERQHIQERLHEVEQAVTEILGLLRDA